MNPYLFELAKQCPNITISIKLSDLIEVIDYCVEKARKELEQQITNANTEIYLNPDEVAKLLGVTRSTLWRWDKAEYLKSISLGAKRKYRMSDVKRIQEGKGRSAKKNGNLRYCIFCVYLYSILGL